MNAEVKNKYIRQMAKDLEHLQNSSSANAIKEDAVFKGQSIKLMSDQVSALVEEISTRDDIKEKYMDLSSKFQASVKDK